MRAEQLCWAGARRAGSRGAFRRGAAVVWTTVLVVGALAWAAPDRAAAAPDVGVQFHAMWGDYTNEERTAVLDKLAAAHVGWVRVDLGWRSFEESAPGAIGWWHVNLADSVIDAARARGLKVLVTLWATPAWANNNAWQNVPPNDVSDYARFAGWAADHFRGRVAAWQIWNEPNIEIYWAGRDPARYAQLVRAAYPAIKAADPGALVVAGGVSQNSDEWLEEAYKNSIGGSFDVLATHPYPGPSDAPPELPDDGNYWTMDHVRAVRNLMVRWGDGAKPIWFTEFGWSSHQNQPGTPGWRRGVSEQTQGEYLRRTISWATSQHPYVTNMFWYNERNRVTGDIREDNFGLLRRDLSEKPAYWALKRALASR